MIGLAQKAGKVASGEFSTEKAVKEHLRICVNIIKCQCISLAIRMT